MAEPETQGKRQMTKAQQYRIGIFAVLGLVALGLLIRMGTAAFGSDDEGSSTPTRVASVATTVPATTVLQAVNTPAPTPRPTQPPSVNSRP